MWKIFRKFAHCVRGYPLNKDVCVSHQIEVRELIGASRKLKHVVSAATDSNVPKVTFEFWERLLENGESILVLVRHGFINEAMVVHRLSIEHFANISGLLKGLLTEGQLESQMGAELPKQARYIQQSVKDSSMLTPENEKNLQEYLVVAGISPITDPGINTYNSLKLLDLDPLYSQYRSLSTRASHSNLLSAIGKGSASEADGLLLDVKELIVLINAFAAERMSSVSKNN